MDSDILLSVGGWTPLYFFALACRPEAEQARASFASPPLQ